ncbi:hypothetical protein [Cryptosporangium arvum]|nr:hypothetical protein [Cryptosporangium arvum]
MLIFHRQLAGIFERRHRTTGPLRHYPRVFFLFFGLMFIAMGVYSLIRTQ